MELHIKCLREIKNRPAYKIFVRKCEGKPSFVRLDIEKKDNVKIDLILSSIIINCAFSV
jgi:hypothetical protein